MNHHPNFNFPKLSILLGIALPGAIFLISLLVSYFELIPRGHSATDLFYFILISLVGVLPLLGALIGLVGVYVSWRSGRPRRASLVALLFCVLFFFVALVAIHELYFIEPVLNSGYV